MSQRAAGVVLWAAATLLLNLAGCTSHVDRVAQARRLFYQGELARAQEELEKAVERHPKDAEVLLLDLALVHLAAGRPQAAEQTLRQVRDRLDHLEQQDLAESAASLLLDGQQQSYSGEDYERVLVRVMLALTNLLHEGGDAESYALQINAKQQELARRAESQLEWFEPQAYQPLAIGPYVRGMLREANHMDYDDAHRAYAQVVSWQPGFQSGYRDVERAASGRHSSPGHGVLYVFGLVGEGPVKVETTAEATSAALLVADRIVSAIGSYELPPTVAPVKIPDVYVPPRQVDFLVVSTDGGIHGRTEPLCDIAQLAVRQQQLQRPRLIAEAVVRRVVKKGAIITAKDQLNVRSPWTDLALTLAGVAWEATESADTRCWGLLPREVQVVRIELPAGHHTVRLQPARYNFPVGPPATLKATITDGRNTYALAYFPGSQPVGTALVRGPQP